MARLWTDHDIAIAFRLTPPVVRAILGGPFPDPARRIAGGLAELVRRRSAAGESVGTIARALMLEASRVEAFLQGTRRRPGPRPSRPPRPPIDPEWGPMCAAGDVAPAIAAAELLELARAEDLGDGQGDDGPAPSPAIAEDWGSPHAAGGGRPRSLAPADIERARSLRARGVTLAEVARDLGVSVSTVVRTLGRRS